MRICMCLSATMCPCVHVFICKSVYNLFASEIECVNFMDGFVFYCFSYLCKSVLRYMKGDLGHYLSV